jgi:hypothetical protein
VDRPPRIEIDDYRALGERVVALGVVRGPGTSSHVEVTTDFAPVLVVRDSRIVLVDSYGDHAGQRWKSTIRS